MDPELYRAAMNGNIEVIVQYKDQLEVQLTPNQNTVLHVAALSDNNSSPVVKEVLKLQPSLLCKVNNKGETALHVAAREGHKDSVEALIEKAEESSDSDLESGIRMAKEMMRMVNNDGNTALHEAVWKEHVNVVSFLVDKDPEFLHPANKTDETPLYLAAERGSDKIVSKILTTSKSPTYTGPYARTALHGAVMERSKECTRLLLEWKPSLSKESDEHGWMPLHYAVEEDDNSPVVKQLLNADKSVAYNYIEYNNISAGEYKNKMAPLHLAAKRGKTKAIEELISCCPDCLEMVDGKGQNILHLAINYQEPRTIRLVLKDFRFSGLINQKDENGNTPFHLLVDSDWGSKPNLRMGFLFAMIIHPGVDKSAFNKKKMTPVDIAIQKRLESGLEGADAQWDLVEVLKKYRRGRGDLVNRNYDAQDFWKKRRDKSIPEGLKRRADTHLIVAAFIATVTFAAGFTVPGGYNSTKGTAVLVRASAFKAFVITDALAMALSTSAVFLHFASALNFGALIAMSNQVSATTLTFWAMISMDVAFITGMYAVLAESLALAISVLIIGLLFVFGLFHAFYRWSRLGV